MMFTAMQDCVSHANSLANCYLLHVGCQPMTCECSATVCACAPPIVPPKAFEVGFRDAQVMFGGSLWAVAHPLADYVHWERRGQLGLAVVRRFWKSFGHGLSPARSSRSNCVRQLALGWRWRVMTNSASSSPTMSPGRESDVAGPRSQRSRYPDCGCRVNVGTTRWRICSSQHILGPCPMSPASCRKSSPAIRRRRSSCCRWSMTSCGNSPRVSLAQEKPGQTLQATALVHEAYLRLIGPGARGSGLGLGTILRYPFQLEPQSTAPAYNSRGHFFAAAAEAMRRILVEGIRRKQSVKHGGTMERADAAMELVELPAPPNSAETLAVHEILDLLAARIPAEGGSWSNCGIFAGCTQQEAAANPGISAKTPYRRIGNMPGPGSNASGGIGAPE